MTTTTIAAVAAALLVWSVLSARLGRVGVTGPMTLLGLGIVAGATGLVDVLPEDAPVDVVAEAALALLLFSDAARVDVVRLRHDAGLPGRLLLIGLPLTVALGTLAGLPLLPAGTWAVALVVATCLAPTDAGLGAAVVTDERVPRRIRRTLNVESGLNDGIIAPVVSVAIAIAADEEVGGTDVVSDAVSELGIGLVVGLVVGLGGSYLLRLAHDRDWFSHDAAPLAILSLAVLGLTVSLAAGGNGFIGAFVAGLAFGSTARELRECEKHPEDRGLLDLTELGGSLLGSVVWFVFGAVLVGQVLEHLTVGMVVYAVLSLTVVRMVPVVLSLTGTHLAWPTAGFLGWFGPRGLASLIFALEAADHLPDGGDEVFAVIGCTVVLSVLAHGATAGVLAARYGRWSTGLEEGHPAMAPVTQVRTRARWLRH